MRNTARVKKLTPRPYWCRHCQRVIRRESRKATLKSYCGRTGRESVLRRLP